MTALGADPALQAGLVRLSPLERRAFNALADSRGRRPPGWVTARELALLVWSDEAAYYSLRHLYVTVGRLKARLLGGAYAVESDHGKYRLLGPTTVTVAA